MSEQTLRYALAKQVPDMERGFTVATSYGDIVIPPGKLATRLKGHMQRALMRRLLEMELAKPKPAMAIPAGVGASALVNAIAGGKSAAAKGRA